MSQIHDRRLNQLQFVLLIHSAQLGGGILTLPRELAEGAGTDGWICIFVGWAASVLACFFLHRTMIRNPQSTLYELLERFFGKVLGKCCNLLIVVYTLALAVTSMLSFIGVLNLWVLTNAPLFVMIALFLIPGYMIASRSVRELGTYAEVIFLLTIWMPLLMAILFKEAHWAYLLPLFKDGWLRVLQLGRVTMFSFLGFEIAFFLYPHLKEPGKAFRGLVYANTLTLGMLLISTLLCFVFFAPDEITSFTWPPLNLLKTIEIRVLERFEVVYLSLYMLTISTTVIPYLFVAAQGTKRLLRFKKHRSAVRLLVLGIMGLSVFIDPSEGKIESFHEWVVRGGASFAFVLPLFLWAYGWLASRLRRGSA